jgi:serine/threonine-protein kinase HipA
MSVAEVKLWGRTIGAVSLDEGRDVVAFQYEPEFVRSGIQISPWVMPLSDQVYAFPALARNTFHGLPGLLADSLPDKFGNALIDAWLATQGRTSESFNAVERLCYTGSRGMNALEFAPVLGPRQRKAARIDVDALVRLAGEVPANRNQLQGHFHAHGLAVQPPSPCLTSPLSHVQAPRIRF